MRQNNRHKYGAKKAEYDGHTFDSLKECRRYKQLKLLEKGGAIKDLELQPRYKLSCGGTPVMSGARQATYTADFRYFDTVEGVQKVEDVKGMDTSESKLRRGVVKAEFGVDVDII